VDSHYWTPYYLVDGLAGGGVFLWILAYQYCRLKKSKYKVSAFATMTFAVFMLVWNIIIPALGFNRSDTKWSFLLTLWLIPVIYYTLFIPDGWLTKFIDNHLKRIGL